MKRLKDTYTIYKILFIGALICGIAYIAYWLIVHYIILKLLIKFV